jgi:hypothetical protein
MALLRARKPRLSADCPFVAFPITRSALLLRPAADPEQELDLGLFPPVTWPLVRGRSSEPSGTGGECFSRGDDHQTGRPVTCVFVAEESPGVGIAGRFVVSKALV